ncbi:MAG TPA: sugar ABC transporter substrate-binding protein, partial [Baekduia sp.]|nr:sugar ABC transporter substrate-binding protein [Baekduia sp.]
ITSGRYNAIVLAPVTSSSALACVRQAKAADIPVVALDVSLGKDPRAVEPTMDGVVAQVVWGMESNAKNIAGLAKKACEGKDPCNAIVEIATPSDELTNIALQELKDGGAGDNVKVVGTFASNYDAAAVTKALPDLLTAHPDTNVIVMAADNTAVAAIAVVKDAGKDILVTGTGGSRAGVKAVKSGQMFGSLGIWPRQAGVKAAEFALKAINGEKIDQPGVDEFKMDEPQLLYKDNIDEFTPEWGAE